MRHKQEGSLLHDSKIMFIRSMKLSFRSPDAMVTALLVPAILMIVFVYVFGGAMDVGGISVVNFIVPGIILQTIGQTIPTTAIGMNNDVTKGVVNRFRTMPIAKSSLMTGYVLATLLRSLATVTVTIGAAFLVGFRPDANFLQWLIVAGLIALYIIAMAWLAVASGVGAKDPESAAGPMYLVGVLPFLSSGFVPTETMPAALRVFAENQPMTHIINSIRALLLNEPMPDGALRAALLWCVGLIALFYILSVQTYKRKTR